LINVKTISIESKRLVVKPIALNDAPFLIKLFNTSGWLKYIGDRNIHTVKEAEIFIQNAINNNDAALWIIKKRDAPYLAVGMVTFIKRDYLNSPDIGYALMPDTMQMGYALEAIDEMLKAILKTSTYDKINAITLPHNERSIKLLTKLNFKFEKEIINKEELLHLYAKAIIN
jgi:RimJ/RimL family protein N-acetyltransferase